MIYDSRYEDNLVLKRNAFQNLLTNIKNYPIIDIEFVDKDDIDALHENNIWKGYTNNSPCLKVIYGDEMSTKGNVIFAQQIYQEIKDLKNQLQQAKIELNNAIYQSEKYKIAYQENEKVRDNKVNQIDGIWAETNHIENNRLKFLYAGLSVLNLPFSSTYDDYADLTEETNKVLSNEHISFQYDKLDFNYNDETKTKTIDYTILEAKGMGQLLVQLQYVKENGIFTREDEQIFIDNFINFVIGYNYMTLAETVTANGLSQAELDSLRNEVINNDNNTSIHSIKLTDETVQLIKDRLKQIMNNVGIENFSQPNFQDQLKANRSGIEKIIETIQNVINNNLERLRGLYDNIQNTIDTAQNEVTDIENQIKEKENSILEQAGDRIIYGYKYIQLGNNTTWNVNFDTVNKKLLTENVASQLSGTFRIGINNNAYEVPIKGFGDISNQPINIRSSKPISMLASGSNADGIITISGSQNKITSTGVTTITAKNNNVLQDIILDGNTNIKGNETVDGITNLKSTLTVDGATNLKSTLTVDDATNLKGALSVTGNTTIGSTSGGNLVPAANNKSNLGAADKRWNNIYGGTGNFTSLVINGNTIDAARLNNVVNPGSNTTVFWRGDGTWSNILTGRFIVSGNGGPNDNNKPTYDNAAIATNGAGYFAKNVTANKVFNAIFNDYAEYRTTIDLEPGRAVIDCDDGSLKCANNRLLPGAQIISDTFGHIMGEMEGCKTPLAVAGRVLAYPYQNRNNYHAGMAVCSAPGGTVDIMSREEIKEYPDCIIGIVSEIPQYKKWGTDQIDVDGRIWIKIK